MYPVGKSYIVHSSKIKSMDMDTPCTFRMNVRKLAHQLKISQENQIKMVPIPAAIM